MDNSNSITSQILIKSFEPLTYDLKQLLDEKLQEYEISKSQVVALLNMDWNTFEELINGTSKQPSLINVIKVADFLDLDLNEIVPAILKNQSRENYTSIDKAKNGSFIAKHFDIKKLTKVGFFIDDSVEYFEKRILHFFGYPSLFDYEKGENAALFSKTKRKFSDKMKRFWVRSAIECFKKIENQNEYDREALKDIIIKAKPYCQDIENGLSTVCKALYNIGVTVIIQNHLTTTQVRGGTFIVNGKPCIVLTDLNKKYTTIWETLIHELHHVLYDLETIDTIGYHLSGDPDIFLIEDKANEFSREFFCGKDRYNFIKQHINAKFIVEKYAKEWEIHPSFVYSSYKFFKEKIEGKSYYGLYNDISPDYYLAIQSLHPITWRENSISEIASIVKSIFELKVEK